MKHDDLEVEYTRTRVSHMPARVYSCTHMEGRMERVHNIVKYGVVFFMLQNISIML